MTIRSEWGRSGESPGHTPAGTPALWKQDRVTAKGTSENRLGCWKGSTTAYAALLHSCLQLLAVPGRQGRWLRELLWVECPAPDVGHTAAGIWRMVEGNPPSTSLPLKQVRKKKFSKEEVSG